jgi:hypothetical protein
LRYTRPVNRSSVVALLALTLGLAGCKKEEPAATATAPTPDKPTTPEKPTTPTSSATPTAPTSPTTPTTPVAAPAVALDPLLDLVGKDPKSWGVIRAPQDFIDGHAGIVDVAKDAFAKLLLAMKDDSKGPDADAGMRKLFVEFDIVRTTLAASGLHLEKGIAFSVHGEHGVTVLAADDAEAVPKLMRTLSAKPDEVKVKCKTLAAAPGFVACAEDDATLTAFEPAKSAATLRTALGNQLGNETVEASNVVVIHEGDKGTTSIAVRTAGGVLQTDFRTKEADELSELADVGPAGALAVVAPGGNFSWMRLDMAALAKKAAGVPAMAKNMLDALSGEILISGIGASPGAVVLVGLTDPTPIQGLIPMAALAKDNIPKSLPDGSKLDMVVESTDDGKGGKLQVLRLKIEPSAELAKLRDQLGLASELTAFVTNQFAAIGIGTGTTVIPEVVDANAGEPSAALLAALPADFAKDLKAGTASMALHLELDGLHAPGVRDGLVTAFAGIMPADTKMSASDIADVAFAVLSPLSSYSFWTSSATDGGVVFHIAMRGFGDGETDEGKAAKQARFDVATKAKDAAAAYGALVAAYPSSPRIEAYRARAGVSKSGAATGAAAMAGVIAAIAVPAFQKYIERSKAAGAAALPPK